MTGTASIYTNEDELVEAMRGGDERAFEWLVHEYDTPLRRLARDFVATDAVAQEVVQETWLGVVRGLDGFEGRSSLKAWIYTILMNRARTRGVKEHRILPFSSAAGATGSDGSWEGVFGPERFRAAGDWAGWWADPPEAWGPAEQVEQAEVLDLLSDAINALPGPQRIVLSLRDINGWTSEEVCSLLGISRENQRVILHRARRACARPSTPTCGRPMSDHQQDEVGDVDPYGMTCAELVELVTDYLEAALSAEDRARIDAHLSVCPPCVHVLDQWRIVIALTGRLDERHAEELPPDRRGQLMAAFREATGPT